MHRWLRLTAGVKMAAGAVRRRVTDARGTLPFRWFVVLLASAMVLATASAGAGLFALGTWHHVYFDRRDLPDLGPFTRFEFPTIGHIYDANGQPLASFAREYRIITQYADIPPIVRDAILAAEDKRFFSHNGVDYLSVPRVLAKVSVTPGSRTLFPQGGSSITQQLVRGVFLQQQTSLENSHELRNVSFGPRVLSWVIGARNVNMVRRKREETRLALWLEQEMTAQFGSKRRAKEEIFARYASFVYMGGGQYGFARAAEYYLGRPLSTFTADDADKAALLAGIMKSPRDYAPSSSGTARILRRRNQILALMVARGFLTRDQMIAAASRPLPVFVARRSVPSQSSAAVEHVLDALGAADADLGVEALRQGQVHVYSTVDARVQRIVSDSLEHGLARYEARHPRARGLVQGSVVVLRNDDGSVLAETGGRQVYDGRAATRSDFNRARQARRQPGSTMKPIVYLAAFQRGDFSLETLVPDEPISVPNGRPDARKWISNYDGVFKGPIPIREALAESRNAVAVWLSEQVGIDRVLRTAAGLGVVTPLHRYPATALGASEVTLLELATAYRTIASGVVAEPYLIRRIVRGPGELLPPSQEPAPYAGALALIQEGLRGVVRMPSGTAYALSSRAFPIAVMGKTGTTDDFRDALFVGSTYGRRGITVAVWIGFDDNRSLGSRETGGRVALPVFQDVMLRVYGDGVVGPAPAFPERMEQRITRYLQGQL
ncbi:MAG TPA: transglycosylase domain-containing protein [Vicinamibacterales bacterium]|nr:transglycosylase domain-containing protein [Vicinamibacterales bacterium]